MACTRSKTFRRSLRHNHTPNACGGRMKACTSRWSKTCRSCRTCRKSRHTRTRSACTCESCRKACAHSRNHRDVQPHMRARTSCACKWACGRTLHNRTLHHTSRRKASHTPYIPARACRTWRRQRGSCIHHSHRACSLDRTYRLRTSHTCVRTCRHTSHTCSRGHTRHPRTSLACNCGRTCLHASHTYSHDCTCHHASHIYSRGRTCLRTSHTCGPRSVHACNHPCIRASCRNPFCNHPCRSPLYSSRPSCRNLSCNRPCRNLLYSSRPSCRNLSCNHPCRSL